MEQYIQIFTDSPIPNFRLYRKSIIGASKVKKYVHQLLEQGVIRPSTSLSGSPIIIVPNKDGTWRMYVFYKALNKIMLNKRYPLPIIDDLLDRLRKEKYFTKMDLKF